MATLKEKRDDFRMYLEECGIIQFLTRALTQLYEMKDRPMDGLDFLRGLLAQIDEIHNQEFAKGVTKTSSVKEASAYALNEEKGRQSGSSTMPISTNYATESTKPITNYATENALDEERKRQSGPSTLPSTYYASEHAAEEAIQEKPKETVSFASFKQPDQEEKQEMKSTADYKSNQSIVENAISRHNVSTISHHTTDASEYRPWPYKPSEDEKQGESPRNTISNASTWSERVKLQESQREESTKGLDSFKTVDGTAQ